ncbi:MAG: hypothetical protein JAY67_20355 [Candidatus Thiodiazotropha taylori]|nr:hypothetical protein [Shewanella sp.]MCF1458733.1 hypothetical protein [Shewanella sp.]MCG7927878.1 hypothetical protein [Candidatus Thiodiazotropha taylori]MCG7936316.1 hypothetical protein [Candidatus Thiodiazotropha taylori]
MTTKNGTPKKPRSRRKPARIWHLVTNHQNMLYMLAAGMVMGPAGFRGKHYSDPLSVYPGWIPLFRDKVQVPADALNHATRERKHLLPCIVSFDLTDLSGPVRMLSRDGRMRDVASPAARKRKDDIALLVRAPLPPTLLSSINFSSSEDRQAFESAANDVSNVDLSPHQIEIAESLFSSDTEVAWPAEQPQELPLEDGSDTIPVFGQALGGVLAMLYHTANRSDLGLAAFRLVTGDARSKDSDLVQSDPILAELPKWIDGSEISGQVDTRARLFWGVIQTLVDTQTQKRPQTPIDAVLAYLENQLDLLQEMEFRPRLERLITDMRGFLGLGGGTITELLERHKGSLSRPLLLFCLRERCTDLLEFSHPLLKDAEYILAGILFGVRDSWLQLPKEMRDPHLSAYVAFRMADAEHRKQAESLSMSAPLRPKPLRELFTSPRGEWNSMKRDVAVELASKCNWNDCFQTRITLAESPVDDELPESFERQGLQVVLPGRVKTVTEEVDDAKLLHRLGQWPPITPKIESEVREKLALATEKTEQTTETRKHEDDTEPASGN